MNDRAEKHVQAVKGGQLSRREFMAAMAAAGLSSAAASALLAPEAKAAMSPKRGGHARVGFRGGSTTDSLDTAELTSEFASWTFLTILGHLTEVGPDGQLEPSLAESYEPNADATEWTFNLRKGVEFHNGKALDAEDWMFSIAYAAESNWNESHWKHDKFNQLLKAARAEVDEARRRDMYVEMQSITRDEGGSIIPLFGNHVMAHSTEVAHPETVAGNWEMDGGKCLERWWFA